MRHKSLHPSLGVFFYKEAKHNRFLRDIDFFIKMRYSVAVTRQKGGIYYG